MWYLRKAVKCPPNRRCKTNKLVGAFLKCDPFITLNGAYRCCQQYNEARVREDCLCRAEVVEGIINE